MLIYTMILSNPSTCHIGFKPFRHGGFYKVCITDKIFSFGVHFIKTQSTMAYLFTSESVSEGHPDKVADQISDALIDNFLAWDPQAKIACETLVTTGQVVLAGEVKCNTYIDVQ